MKQVSIVGTGMSAATTTAEGLAVISQAEVLIGAKRMVETFADLKKPSYAVYQLEEVAAAIADSDAQRLAVLVSGDTGFYSSASKLYAGLREHEIKLIPGVSSVSYLFARCGLSWQDAALVSCHGTDTGIVSAVRRHRLTFALTGGNIPALAQMLAEAGFEELPVRIGENLGRPGESITPTTVAALLENEYASLAVLLIENENFAPGIRTGIPDGEFIRTEIPMTKSEARALVMSRLTLRETDVCYDIGCGTGSVTVEMALSAHQGCICAIDKSQAALALTAINCRKFHIGNVRPVLGTAPEAFAALPPPDAAFIGGSAGNLDRIIRALLSRNPQVRIVITAIALESALTAIKALETAGIETEAVQLSAARSKRAGSLHLLTGQNPVFIISGGGI